MLLSRFWYLILSFALAAAAGILYIAHGFYNRQTERSMNEALMADASSVAWYLKDDARNRAAVLLPVALAPDLREPLAKASESEEVAKEMREKAHAALAKAAQDVPDELKFHIMFAVDADGRVIARHNYPHRDDWNLGGYAVVADALAGWIRDDAWVLQGMVYRVVARPVERDGGGEPVGAVIGLTPVDAAFAHRVAQATGARVAFYVFNAHGPASGIPQSSDNDPNSFKNADFSVMNADIKAAAETEEYLQKGRSLVRRPSHDVGVVYTRLPGEAWDLGGGYIVARKVTLLKTPLSFFEAADQADKDRAPQSILIGIALGLGILGILFSIVEHTLPLRGFQRVAHMFALGKLDTLAPSRFRGTYKKIAADINDGVDKALSKGGITRRAADLESVIGPLPAQPQMSAFAVPEASTSSSSNMTSSPAFGSGSGGKHSSPGTIPASERSVPRIPQRALPAPPPRPSDGGGAGPAGQAEPETSPEPPPSSARPSRRGHAPPAIAAPPASAPGMMLSDDDIAPGSVPPAPNAANNPTNELADWQLVYEDFLRVKKQCGEATEGLTFDRFKGTLQRNKAALVSRHSCSGVKFTVYVKDGKAALRASPIK